MTEPTTPPEAAPPASGFADLGLAPELLTAIHSVGYEAPSPIQAAAIPPLLAGRDLFGQAQTGTGKTAAFALPLLSRLDLRGGLQILVLTPTRELALQVAEAMQTYARNLPGFHVLPVYGGADIAAQMRQLSRGVHAVVGTPGRVQDHLRRGTLKLDGLFAVVLDEADEMLRMGFLEEVESILEHTPPGRQVALFSATLPMPIKRVASKHLKDPVTVHIETKTATVAAVSQRYLPVVPAHKLDALTRLLEVEDFDAMLVFVRTRVATTELAEKLEARGFAASALSGEMGQSLRERAIERLKNGQLDILVATDVAARGLDVDRISHVVNYDIPYDVEAYVHRIGRTGRAGRAGVAILFASPREQQTLRAIERATRQSIERIELPSREAIAGKRIAQFKETVANTLTATDLDFFTELVEEMEREQETSATRIAAALAFLVQKDRPLRPELETPSAKPYRPPSADAEPRSREPRPRDAFPEARPGGVSFSRPEGRPESRPERPPRPRPEGAGEPGRYPGARDAAPAREPRLRDATPRAERERAPLPNMERFRIAVGRVHGVAPKNIVGAIANEAGLEGRYISNIEIHDTWTLVDLPAKMPPGVFKHLKRTKICGQELRIEPVAGAPRGPATAFRERPRSFDERPRSFDDRPRTFDAGKRGTGGAKPRTKRPPRP